jgi:hypothetical protein
MRGHVVWRPSASGTDVNFVATSDLAPIFQAETQLMFFAILTMVGSRNIAPRSSSRCSDFAIIIMPFSFAASIAPIHLLAYSTLLGTELYQSFVMTKVAYQALPRSAFTSLQKRVFPIYFRGQSLLLLLVAATVPPRGPISLARQWTVWVPIIVAGATAALNLLVYGPETQKVMIERVHQGENR